MTQDTKAPILSPDIRARAEGFVGRLWVLDQVVVWLGQRSERFLFLTGEPGSGKTALAAWLAGAGPLPDQADPARNLERVRVACAAAHFCVARGQGGTTNPSRFAQSVAQQLSNRYDAYAEAAIERLAPEYDIRQDVRENWGQVIGVKTDTLIVAGRNPVDVYDRAVRQPLLVLAEGQPDLSLVILVDGLDEAITFDPPNIVTLLAGSRDLPPGVRFLLTSRNERRVIDQFDDAHRLDLSAEEQASANEADVRSYIEKRVRAPGLDLSTGQGKSAADAVDELVEQAAGNFLYAKFVLDEVVEGRRSPADLSGLPRGLYGLYRIYLDRLMPAASGYGANTLWLEKYEPLLGSVSVAVPAAPEAILPKWLGWDKSELFNRLDEVAQVTEYVPDDGGGYRLYHRSMVDFLASERYQDNGSSTTNRYYVDPRRQHERIVSYYLDRIRVQGGRNWERADPYGLRQIVGHLKARLDLSEEDDRKHSQDLFAVVLDEGLHAAQLEVLGDVYATLADLRTGLDVALAGDDLVNVLRCVALYRQATRTQSITRSIFDAAAEGDFPRALRGGARHGVVAPKPRGTWSRALQFYLAWEAAEAGNEEAARQAVADAENLLPSMVDPLADALLARAARVLAGGEGDPRQWLAEVGRGQDADWLLDTYDVAGPVAQAELRKVESELDRYIQTLETEPAGSPFADSPVPPALDEESTSELASELGRLLTKIASYPSGQDGIDRALALALTSGYLRYRDIGLVAIGISALAVPDPWWVRRRIQDGLQAGLDAEGVTFTFDLPSILELEVERRGLSAPDLAAFVSRAQDSVDRWGTAVRAGSARAAALHWQGRPNEAMEKLVQAAERPTGFSGYGTMTLLALISRCHEFGVPDRASEPVWGPRRDFPLGVAAMQAAGRVRDGEFRQERVELVQQYLAWLTEPPVDFETLRATLPTMSDPDVRRAYKDLASARWSADPTPMNRQALKALVPLVLNDSATLDAVLGRLFGPRLRALDDGDLRDAFEVCATHFTTGRPWEMSTPPPAFA